MSNLFKSVRIVHSPKEERYYVEQKKCWSFSWEKVDAFDYVKVRSSSPHGCHDLMDNAFERAKKKAEMLLAKSVVWEQTNYFWG
jgi:hypothetical protein